MKQLPIISHRKAVQNANEKIKESMEVEHPGLLCRWDRLNELIGGHFRFSRIITIAGASGSGKSYFLNMLRDDFISTLNAGYHRPYKVLSFSLEMDAADEIIRTYSGKLKTDYNTLLSAKKKLTQEQYAKIVSISQDLITDKLYFVEQSGTRDQIWDTVERFNNKFPSDQLVITIDHTLLVEYLDEKSEVELVSHLSRLAMKMKKVFGALVILLGQLNDKIEHPDRRNPDNVHLHYPTKTDLHGSKAVYMASDDVWVLHAPEHLGMVFYGPDRFPTKDLIVLHILKGRFTGITGALRFRNKFYNGTLEYPYEMPRF